MRKGPVVALFALIAVVIAAYFAYGMLASSYKTPEQKASQTHQADAHASVDASSDEHTYMLADYDATVFDENGNPTTLTEVADGKPLVINFWATWCPYCVEEMPDYLDLVNEYEGRIAFAFINCTDGKRETIEGAKTWLAENGFTALPVYYDVDSRAVYSFGATSLPLTLVVSPDGEIVAATLGRIDASSMRTELDSLL